MGSLGIIKKWKGKCDGSRWPLLLNGVFVKSGGYKVQHTALVRIEYVLCYYVSGNLRLS